MPSPWWAPGPGCSEDGRGLSCVARGKRTPTLAGPTSPEQAWTLLTLAALGGGRDAFSLGGVPILIQIIGRLRLFENSGPGPTGQT